MAAEPRDRTVSFRLTKEEHQRFRELCFTNGVRSVSDMVRTGIYLLLQQPARVPHEALEARVAELESRLHLLSLEIRKLSHQQVSAGSSQ